VPVAADGLANAILRVVKGDLQVIPLEIDDAGCFGVLNSTRIVDCLDESESEFIKWTKDDHRPDLAGNYQMVTRLVVDKSRIPADAHAFRIHGWRIALIVSETVKAAMEEIGCFGALFEDVTS
jgi:hypothetical protein